MLQEHQLQFFAAYIKKELGIIYDKSNFFQLAVRITEISKALGFENEEKFHLAAQQGISGHMKQILLDTATNNETSFFRDPKIFTAIEKHVVTALRAQNAGMRLIRVWSAASSFGQEPYSLAMCFAEMASKDPGMPRVEIQTTDASERALLRSKEGRYSQLEVQRGMPAAMLVKYFNKTPDNYWVVKPDLKLSVQVSRLNLLEPYIHMGTFDLILCRNVLIYQTEEKKKDVLDRMADRLTPNGYLFLGASESMMGLSERFHQHYKDGVIFFQRKV